MFLVVIKVTMENEVSMATLSPPKLYLWWRLLPYDAFFLWQILLNFSGEIVATNGVIETFSNKQISHNAAATQMLQ